MDYHEAANRLFDLRRYPTKPGTASTAALLDHLGSPQEALDCVQVAGSNGKGSTVRMLECVLREAGYSVGRYTSPHLSDVRERFVVDGREIPGAAVATFVEECGDYLRDSAATGEPTTFFEATTALALWFFERRDVDVAILEVGIGGQFDATSVVDPIASAVTNVTLEHTDVLGETVAEIARDKAAVAPAEGPLVTGATGDALAAIESATDRPVTTVGFPEESPAVAVTYDGMPTAIESAVTIDRGLAAITTRLPLHGPHQARNAGVATVLARQVADAVASERESIETAISDGLRRAHWPGRTEIVSREPLVMLDGAHNPGACRELAGVLEELEYDDLILVFGALIEKDHSEMAAALPEAAHVVVCEPDRDRAADSYVLREVFEAAGTPSVERIHAVSDAVAAARERATPDDLVLVTGSLYTVGEARERWTGVQVPKRVASVRESKRVLQQAGVTDAGTKRMRGKGPHRVVHARVRRRQADYLKQELLSIGGECAVSKLQREEEFVEVVMMGTLAQFRQLCRALEPQPYGLRRVGEDVRETLAIGTDPRPDDPAADPVPSAVRNDGTAVMGILNVTPDSFHDGGQYDAVEDAVARAEELVADGAAIVDVGGESTRPGADPVPVDQEIDRVVPVIEAIADLEAAISIDTRKAPVAEAALDAGADLINDVSGLADPELRLLVAERDVPVVVMHSVETPVDPDRAVQYDDVVADVIADLADRIALGTAAGIDREQIIVDPGLGFGKSAAESFALLDRLPELRALGCPILLGHSQKSMFGRAGYEAGNRTHATVGATALAAERGADVVRVHDVAENVAAVRAVDAATRPESIEE